MQERSIWAMVRATLTRALWVSGAVALCIALISSAIAQTPGSKTPVASGVYTLLGQDDPPVHIGDGAGAIDDIERSLRSSNPPDHYTRSFKLDEVPDTIIFTVTIFSLTSEWDCPTTAWLNGMRVYDLREGENVGSGETTTVRFLVEKRHLKVGKNTIQILEEECTDTDNSALNDSLVKGLTYVFSSVAAAKGPELPTHAVEVGAAQAASCDGVVIKRLIAGSPWGGAWETDAEEFVKMVFVCGAAGSISGTFSRGNTQQSVPVTITGNKVSWKVKKTFVSFALKEEDGSLVLSGKITGTTEASDEFENGVVLFSGRQTVARLVKNSLWKGTWESSRGSKPFQVTFKIVGGKLTGTAWQNSSPMKSIAVVGNRVTFHIINKDTRKIDFEGFLKEGNLSGTAGGPGRRNPNRRFTVDWEVSPSSN